MKGFLRAVALSIIGITSLYQVKAVSVIESHVNVSCNAGNNGSINITAFGGTAPYVYLWNDTVISEDRTNLAAGTYSVTITDLSAQTTSLTVTITEPLVLTASLTAIPVSCFGGSNGAINTTRSGGTAPYSYLWNDGAFTQNRTGLTSGTYSVTITDMQSCTVSASVFVPQPLFALTATAIPSPLACVGGPSGSVITNVSGGTGPYTYWWGGGIVTPLRLNLFSGTYCVTATDANGCTANACATIPPYNPLTISSTQINNTCYGDSAGVIDLTVMNGSTPYSFAWSNSAITEDVSDLKAGSYTVTVTDNNTCTITHNVIISQPSFPITVNTTIADPTCYGSNNGYINLNVTNGVAPYTYDWGSGVISQNRTGLGGGSFAVTVTDNNGCVVSASSTLNEPTPLVVTPTATDVRCYGESTGSVHLTAFGSFAPYSYDWNDGAVTQNRDSVFAGYYDVIIIDNHGCSASAGATVNQPAAPVSITAITGDVSCFGGNNGWISLNVTGGSSPYTYDWGGGITSQNRTNLTSGNYTVIVTDSAACVYSASATINEPAALATTISKTDISCNGDSTGAVDLSVTGGIPPYNFSWNNGSTMEDLTGVASGNYAVVVIDANGCTVSNSATITQPTAVSISLATTNVNCNGGSNGSITTTISGGVSPFNFIWNDSFTSQNRNGLAVGNYSVTATDANNCSVFSSAVITEPTLLVASATVTHPTCNGVSNGSIDLSVSGGAGGYLFSWSNTSTAEDISNLAGGNYLVNITDANNCITSVSATLISPAALQVSTVVTGIGCSGASAGTIDLTVSGGSMPYSYSWSNGATTQDITNLPTGNYSVNISDANSCSASASTSITAVPSLNTSISKTDVSCFGTLTGAIDLTINGGMAPFTFAWSNSAVTEDLQGLGAGNYAVIVTDSNQCTATASTIITQPALIQIDTAITPVSCFGKLDGAINITITNGVFPYTFLWNNTLTTEDISGLRSASYSVTVTDDNNCTAARTNIPVPQSSQIIITPFTNPVSCIEKTNGSVAVQVTGGSFPYAYLWNTQAITQSITNAGIGTYRVTVTDSRGCTASASQYLESLPAIAVASQVSNTACQQVKTGAIDLTVNGGTPSYTFSWSNGSQTEDLTDIGPGNYDVTVSDNRDCSATASFDISFYYELTAEINGPSSVTAGETVQFSVITNANHSNTYTWWPQEEVSCPTCAETQATLQSGRLLVSVSDENGCLATDSVLVEVNPVTDYFIPNVFTPNKDGANDVFELAGDKSDITFLTFAVFNRWGEKVFDSDDQYFRWDGTFKGQDLPPGMYTYTMKVSRDNSSAQKRNGTVLLMR